MSVSMWWAPTPCACADRHTLHCGDCGGAARRVRCPETSERVIVCLTLGACGHVWRTPTPSLGEFNRAAYCPACFDEHPAVCPELTRTGHA